MVSGKELGIYIAIIVIIAAAVAWLASNYLLQKSYALSVQFQQLSPQSSVYPYQIGNFRVLVNNTGGSAISSLIVAVYANNKLLHSYTISNLGGNSGVTLNVSYIYPTNGVIDFEAIADPSQVLPIQNRSSAKSSFMVNVSTPEIPNVYTSVPNGNIKSTESFSLLPEGLVQALFISTFFNISQYRWLTGNNNATIKLFETLAGSTVSVNGAYTVYNDSTASYVAWSQTIANQSQVYNALLGLNSPLRNVSVSGSAVTYAKLSAATSACEFYDRGWTKIIEFTNSTTNQRTCLSLVANTTNGTQTSAFVNALKANPSLARYQSIFKYLNSTSGGSALIMDNSSIAAFDLFQSSYGFFGSYIRANLRQANLSSLNATCAGFVFSLNGTNVCSKQVYTKAQLPSQYLLDNSTEISQNYTATLYSLVNRTQYGYSAQVSGSSVV